MKNRKIGIILFVTFLICICISAVVVVNYIKNKRKGELEEKLVGEDIGIRDYMTGRSAPFEEFLTECKLRVEDINQVAIGVNNNGRINEFYIDDAQVVKSVCERLRGVVIEGVQGDSIMGKYEGERSWSIVLYSDKEYAFSIDGRKTTEDNIESIMMNVCFAGETSTVYYTQEGEEIVEWYPEAIIGSYIRQLIIDENIGDFIFDIYKNNVKAITKQELVEIHKKGEMTLQDIFRYTHSKTGDGEIEEYEYMEGYIGDLYTDIFKFPISDTECYIKVEKGATTIECVGSEIYINGEKRIKPIISNEIVRVEIFDEAGNGLDFYKSTEEELKEFIR